MTDIGTKVAQLAQLRQAISDMCEAGVDSEAHRREAIEQPECACTRTGGAPPENTEAQHEAKQ